MSLELSLYHLAEGGDLLELFEMRAEAERETASIMALGGPDTEQYLSAKHDLDVLEDTIAMYIALLPKKVDAVRAVWRRIETLIEEAAAEVKFQSKRGQHLKADLERLKDYSQRCMELIEWPANKPRKLMGRSGYLLLKANGGRPGVEITDEALVSDEFCTVTITFRADSEIVKRAQSKCPQLIAPRVPSLSLIAEALGKPCPKCAGAKVVCSFCHGFDDYCGDVARCDYCNGTRRASEYHAEDCPDCGGSGKQSVPGARLKPAGQHVEVK